jgi:hypothetical protein
MDFEADRRRDGRGVLFVQVFDRPLTGLSIGRARPPLVEVTYPAEAATGEPIVEASIVDLKPQRFDDLPARVYVRSVFTDDPNGLGDASSGWEGWLRGGRWLGGSDFSQGLSPMMPLEAIELTPGQSTTHRQALTALRNLQIRLKLADGVEPLDDGQGPAVALAFRDPVPSFENRLYGVAASECVTLSEAGEALVEGAILGSGEFYLLGTLNDFDASSEEQEIPGGLLSIELTPGQLPTLLDTISVGERQYSAQATVLLRQVFPWPGGAVGPGYSCTTSGLPRRDWD